MTWCDAIRKGLEKDRKEGKKKRHVPTTRRLLGRYRNSIGRIGKVNRVVVFVDRRDDMV
jgi:hypothetical protein